MKISVDINCDMGESFGAYKIGRDEEVIRCISSSNIACGFHASDPNVMERTVRLCKDHGVMAGAHPGYPDLPGFGRRFLDMGKKDLLNSVIYQVGALQGFLAFYKMPLQHVKMHGALFNHLIREEALYLEIVEGVRKAFGDVIFLTLATPATAKLKKAMKKKGVKIALEAFPDRNYTDSGELLSRGNKEAVLKDPDAIAKRAALMVKEKGVKSINGRWLTMEIDTLCMHGDNPESIDAAKKLKAYFEKEGIVIKPLAALL
ncbi:MAG TPA: 5-oxoprolinase subunit PxpA [Syntrophales bacterium]|nr:5-oxoprolinase subunit PxpA [Syntrophales bacterium]